MNSLLKILYSVILDDKFFDIKTRANLFEYWVILIFYLFMPIILTYIIKIDTILNIINFYFLIIAPWIIFSVNIRRLHDLNLSGFWIILIIPILALPFIKGKKEKNKYDNN